MYRNKQTILLLTIALVLFLSAAGPARAQSPLGDPSELFNLFEGLPFRSAVWSSVRTVVRQGQSLQMHEQNLLKGPLLKVISTDTSGATTVIYADHRNKSLIFYQPATNSGLRMDLQQMVAMTGSGGRRPGRKVATESILGYPCEVVEAETTITLMGLVVRVRYKDWLWRKFPMKSIVEIPDLKVMEMVLPGSVTTVEVTGLKANVAIPDAEFHLPPGAKIQAAPGQLPLVTPGEGPNLPF